MTSRRKLARGGKVQSAREVARMMVRDQGEREREIEKGVESERLRRERERRASSRRRWRSERREEAGVKLEMKLDRRKEEGGVMVRGSKGDAISSSQQQEPGEARRCV